MAPLTRVGVLSLMALTLHYSLLSIVLHISLHSTSTATKKKYHTSSLVLLTELFKIVLSVICVYLTKELRPQMLELKRSRWEQEEKEEIERDMEDRPPPTMIGNMMLDMKTTILSSKILEEVEEEEEEEDEGDLWGLSSSNTGSKKPLLSNGSPPSKRKHYKREHNRSLSSGIQLQQLPLSAKRVNSSNTGSPTGTNSTTSSTPTSPESTPPTPASRRRSNSNSTNPLRISVEAAQALAPAPSSQQVLPFAPFASSSASRPSSRPFLTSSPPLSNSPSSSLHAPLQASAFASSSLPPHPTTPSNSSSFPLFALIPATPAAPPSPFRPPNPSQLFPTRTPRPVLMPHLGLMDFLDRDSWSALKAVVVGKGWWKLGIPSALFVFQANAQYVASANLSVPLFQLAYQLKIPATALFSVILLQRSLTTQQWFSLALLTSGIAIVQISASASHHPHSSSSKTNVMEEESVNQTLGLLAVLAACLSSGFASTYFERMLKSPAGLIPSAPTHASFSSTSSTASNGSSSSSKTLTSCNNPHISFSNNSTSSPPMSSSASDDRHLSLPPYLPLTPSTPPPSLWIRNIQLSLFGLLFILPLVFYDLQYNSYSNALSQSFESVETMGVEVAERFRVRRDLFGKVGAVAAAAASAKAEPVSWNEEGGGGYGYAGGYERWGVKWIWENFFHGFDGMAWGVVALQVTGGLLGAIVMQHADNLLKNFATSVSILISAAVSTVLFDFEVTTGFVIGAFMVLFSTWAYVTKTVLWKR